MMVTKSLRGPRGAIPAALGQQRHVEMVRVRHLGSLVNQQAHWCVQMAPTEAVSKQHGEHVQGIIVATP